MSKRPNLLRVMIAITSLLVASFAAVVVQPSPAQARCAGEGNRVNSRLIVGGRTYVTESPNRGTCNGNGLYQASYEPNQPGWSAAVVLRTRGYTVFLGWHSGTRGLRIERGGDAMRMTLCATNFRTVYCGWGSEYEVTSYPATDFSNYGWLSGY